MSRELLKRAADKLRNLYAPPNLVREIDEYLEMSEPEPVAWGCDRYIEDDNGFQIGTDEPELAWGKYAPDDNGWYPLYTTPPDQSERIAELKAALQLAKDMMIANDLSLPRTFEVIDEALAKAKGEVCAENY